MRRLPPEEQEWLDCTGAALLVPVHGAGSSRSSASSRLGERKSEEAYTAEDRELLASIAAQMGLGFDVARLRRRTDNATGAEQDETRLVTTIPADDGVPALRALRGRGRRDLPGRRRADEAGAGGAARASTTSTGIEQLLGRGGMGAVYRARDMRLDRLVAVKVVRAELLGDPEARRRFRREAQIVARLQHPVESCPIFDFGTFADGGAYLVMELVRGEDLRRVLQREGRLEPERAVRILASVCAAIEAAHREGVLHRDLKPENILLPATELEAKVLDFGVAKRRVAGPPRADGCAAEARDGADGRRDDHRHARLHGARTAPRQPPDARTDVFSLGVIAYEMLSGELPFGRGIAGRGRAGAGPRHAAAARRSTSLPAALARADPRRARAGSRPAAAVAPGVRASDRRRGRPAGACSANRTAVRGPADARAGCQPAARRLSISAIAA